MFYFYLFIYLSTLKFIAEVPLQDVFFIAAPVVGPACAATGFLVPHYTEVVIEGMVSGRHAGDRSIKR